MNIIVGFIFKSSALAHAQEMEKGLSQTCSSSRDAWGSASGPGLVCPQSPAPADGQCAGVTAGLLQKYSSSGFPVGTWAFHVVGLSCAAGWGKRRGQSVLFSYENTNAAAAIR